MHFKCYIGMTDNTAKSRFADHDMLLKYSTTLFTSIWDLKDNDTDFTIEWSIYLRASPYKGRPSICNFFSFSIFHLQLNFSLFSLLVDFPHQDYQIYYLHHLHIVCTFFNSEAFDTWWTASAMICRHLFDIISV